MIFSKIPKTKYMYGLICCHFGDFTYNEYPHMSIANLATISYQIIDRNGCDSAIKRQSVVSTLTDRITVFSSTIPKESFV